MTKPWHADLVRLVQRAMRNGGERINMFRYRWDISQDCENGFSRLLYAAPALDRVVTLDLRSVWPDSKPFEWSRTQGHYRGMIAVDSKSTKVPLELELITRCRRCAACRKYRATIWRRRAYAEILHAERTWFGTLTLRSEEHYRVLLRARKIYGDGFDALDLDEQFGWRCKAFAPEITKYLKRVRKQSGSALRYLLVAEAHKSGLPHFHILVHERNVDEPVRHSCLTGQWPFGFTNFKLVTDPRAGHYVAKYLSKSVLARVRASQRYGHGLSRSEEESLNVKTMTSNPNRRLELYNV